MDESLSLAAQVWVAVIAGAAGAISGAAASWVVAWWRSAEDKREQVRALAVDVIASARGLWAAAQEIDSAVIELQATRRTAAYTEIFPGDEDLRREAHRMAEERRQEGFRLRRDSLERGEHATAALALLSARLEAPAAALLQASKAYTHKDPEMSEDRHSAALRSFARAVKAEVRTKGRRRW